MWDRPTASTPTVTLESTFRQPIRRFTVSRTPPVPLVVSPVCFRVVPVCVSSFPVGSFGERVPRSGLVERSAPSSVARVCRLTPLCTRTTLCRLSLLHHRRRWVSLTYHAYRGPPLMCLLDGACHQPSSSERGERRSDVIRERREAIRRHHL